MDDNTKNHAEFLILSHMIFVDTFVALLATQARKQSVSTLRIKDKKRCIGEKQLVLSSYALLPKHEKHKIGSLFQ